MHQLRNPACQVLRFSKSGPPTGEVALPDLHKALPQVDVTLVGNSIVTGLSLFLQINSLENKVGLNRSPLLPANT